MKYLILIIGLLIANEAAAQEGTQSSLQQPLSHSGDSGKPTANDQRGTNDSPLIVKLAPTPESQAKATQEAAEQKDKASADTWLVRATWLLAVIGILQLFVFGLQARRLGQTIESMEEVSARQLRAYVSAQFEAPFVQGLTPNTQMNTAIAIFNHGNTPAYQVEVKAGIAIFPYALPPNFPLPAPPAPTVARSKTVIHPQGKTMNGTHSEAPITQFEMTQIKRGTHRPYIFGTIRYIDAFKKERSTTFCAAMQLALANVTWDQVYTGGGQFQVFFEYSDQHNTAD